MTASLYLHIPFCLSKCHYCSFSSYPGLQQLYTRYVQALKTELQQLAESVQSANGLETIFVGGGTPTVVPAEDLVDILAHCRDLFSWSSTAEISIEANPGTISPKKLEVLRKGGFNRLSLGVQSFSAAELAALGRCHTPKDAVQGYTMARAAGFENISLDLMYGLSEQTRESWRQTLRTALGLKPDHLSMYQLTVEEGTPFADRLAEGVLTLPDEELILEMDEMNIRACSDAGLSMYEISNFARAGCTCRHNVNYWHNGAYLAAGAGAVSYLGGVRRRRLADPEEYCRKVEAGQDIIVESEKLALDASFRESVIMGLRLTEGVSRDRLKARYGIDLAGYYGTTLERLLGQQLVELTTTHLRLTAKGRVIANYILAELV